MDVMELRRRLLQPHILTIGGLPVLINNAWYINANGRVDEFRADDNFFITGIFDSNSSTQKQYTYYRYPRAPYISSGFPSMRLFNDLSQTSVDYWPAGTNEGSPAPRTVQSAGRYILFTVRKDCAGDVYLYDDTNQRYIFKGKNVT